MQIKENTDLGEHSIAYALAAGLVMLDNSDAAIERSARRARWERRKGRK